MNQKKTDFVKNVLAGIGVCAILVVLAMLVFGGFRKAEDQSALVLGGTSSTSLSTSTSTVASSPAGEYTCEVPKELAKGEAGYGALASSPDGKYIFSLSNWPERNVVKTDTTNNTSTNFASGYQPGDISINKNGTFVTDYAGGHIYKYDASGKVVKTWSYYDSPTKKDKKITGPGILEYNPVGDNFYLKEGYSYGGFGVVILKLVDIPLSPTKAQYVSAFDKFAGGSTNIVGKYNSIGDMAIDTDGSIYIVDNKWHKVMKFDSAGNFKAEIGGVQGSADGKFNSPSGITIVGNDIYVVDRWNNRVQVLDKNMKFVSKFGLKGSGGGGDLNNPTYIVADGKGNVYVVDLLDGNITRLKRFSQPCARITVTKTVTPRRTTDSFNFLSNVAPKFSLSDGGKLPKSTTFDVIEPKNDNYLQEEAKVGYQTGVSCTIPSGLSSGNYLSTSGAKVIFRLWNGQKVQCGYTNCLATEGTACLSDTTVQQR